MDGRYGSRQVVNQSDEVDRFLRGTANNSEFFGGIPIGEPIPSNCEISSIPNSSKQNFEEQRLNVNPADLPVGSVLDGRSNGRIVSLTHSPIKFQQPEHPIYSSHEDGKFKGGKRKKSAFKSVRSFFKRHIPFNANANSNNINNNNYNKSEQVYSNKERLSSTSLHDCAKPNSSSLNSADGLKEDAGQQLSRAHSFSASKMRRDSFANKQVDHSGDHHQRYSSAIGRPPLSPRTSSTAVSVPHYYSALRNPYNPMMSPSRSSSSAFITQHPYSSYDSGHSTRASSSSRLATGESSERAKVASSPHANNVSPNLTKHCGDDMKRSHSNLAGLETSLSVRNRENDSTSVLPIGETTAQQRTCTVETPCLNGILNHGNTCYMNALVQCLACIDRFAQFFVCEQFNCKSHSNTGELPKNSATSILACILQSIWFNAPADGFCLKLLKFMTNESTNFRLSTQQDAQESLNWILDRIHEEIKDVGILKSDILTKQYKSEEQLASDALKRVSGSNKSAIMDLFRAQFRSSMECLSCGFTNLTFDPYMTVSLSVLNHSNYLRSCTALFVPYFNGRQIVRYYLPLLPVVDASKSNRAISIIFHAKSKIMRSLGGTEENLIACQFSSEGHCKFLPDDTSLDDSNNGSSMEYTMVEVPKLSEQQELQQNLIVSIINHVNGFYPNGIRHGLPYVVVLNRQWSYDRIAKCIIEKGSCVLRNSCSPSYNDFKLLIQHPTDGFIHLESGTAMPLISQSINLNLQCQKTKNIFSKRGIIYRILVGWNPDVAFEYLSPDSEMIINDHSFEREVLLERETNTTLTNLLQDYIKAETVLDWKCPKCLKTSGQKQLKFHSIPPVLVFHLKRFELHNDGATKKIDTKVQVPLDGLDMSPYICNPDSRFNTLKSQKESNGFIRHDSFSSPLYDLVGIVRHHGERANSGHYTATTRNPIDGKWRNFDDLKVTLVSQSDESIRTSSDAYLLFYEQRKIPTDLISFDDTPPVKQSSRWFPSEVPKSVVEMCEQQRAHFRGSLGRNSERLRKELNGCSLRDDRRPTYQSGASTFYTGSELDSNISPSIARSYTEQLHNGTTIDQFGSLPIRRSSVLSKTSNNAYSSDVPPPVSWNSNSPRHHQPRNNNDVDPSSSSTPFSYYYETVGTPPLSRINNASDVVIPPLNTTRLDLYKHNTPTTDDRNQLEYKVYSPYSTEHASLADSPRRSKSQYTLSSGSTARSTPIRSPVSSNSYYNTNNFNGYAGYSPISSMSSRSRSSVRGTAASDLLGNTPIKTYHLLSSYRH